MPCSTYDGGMASVSVCPNEGGVTSVPVCPNEGGMASRPVCTYAENIATVPVYPNEGGMPQYLLVLMKEAWSLFGCLFVITKEA